MNITACNNVLFLAMCRSHGLPEPVPEYQFAPPRRWRFDWCFLQPGLLTQTKGIALEIQGGIWTSGRHVRGKALLAEHEKLNEAAVRGYRVLFCTPEDVQSGAIFPVIKRALT